MYCLDPGNGITVRGEGDLFKGVRGEKRTDDAVERSGRLRLLCGFEAALDVLLRAGVFLCEGMAQGQKQQGYHEYGSAARTQNHFHVLSIALGTVIRAGMEGKHSTEDML
jgi:hypothetical protein